MSAPHLFVCIPAINESRYLPETLACLRAQDVDNFTVIVCVNQPETWHTDPDKQEQVADNRVTLDFLRNYRDLSIHIIDKSSPGKGWTGREGGVGSARKVAMDEAIRMAGPDDILVSLDADTRTGPAYLRSLRHTLQQNPEAVALSVPYYHRLTGHEREDRAILRYEIYMRNYALNLWRIRCPYNFTALGSAIALRVSAYRAVGGMTPKKSGEDFYFLQKLRKYGPVLTHNPERVFPAARFSNRVFFGTGPAMIKGDRGDWESYPIYHHTLFDRIGELYALFPQLYHQDIPTPLDEFLSEVFGPASCWNALRENFTRPENFVRACHEKIDALRILQFLKSEQKKIAGFDEDHLRDFLNAWYPGQCLDAGPDLCFARSSLAQLDNIRNFLAEREAEVQVRASFNESHPASEGNTLLL